MPWRSLLINDKVFLFAQSLDRGKKKKRGFIKKLEPFYVFP